MDRRRHQVKVGIRSIAFGLAVVALLGFCAATAAPVVKHGVISKDETWQGEIHVIGDIVVPEGVTLTILPGTIVRITANQDVGNLSPPEPFWMKAGINWGPSDYEIAVFHGEPYRDEAHHISIWIFGTLQAVGTPDRVILITSDSPSPTVWDWDLFLFRHGILSYAIVEYYRALNGALISHCILRHVGECAVCRDSGVVEYSTISYAGHELIDTADSSLVIRSNHLGPNPGNGITAGGGRRRSSTTPSRTVERELSSSLRVGRGS
jgi:hypothetical protein